MGKKKLKCDTRLRCPLSLAHTPRRRAKTTTKTTLPILLTMRNQLVIVIYTCWLILHICNMMFHRFRVLFLIMYDTSLQYNFVWCRRQVQQFNIVIKCIFGGIETWLVLISFSLGWCPIDRPDRKKVLSL